VPSPAARTMAETVTVTPRSGGSFVGMVVRRGLRGEDSNPYKRDQNPLSYR
jgi:hypothetical protein